MSRFKFGLVLGFVAGWLVATGKGAELLDQARDAGSTGRERRGTAPPTPTASTTSPCGPPSSAPRRGPGAVRRRLRPDDHGAGGAPQPVDDRLVPPVGAGRRPARQARRR